MINLLPYDGLVFYYGSLFSGNEADNLFTNLLQTIAWEHEEAIIYGKHIVTKRKAAWYGNAAYAYTYSGITKKALLWTEELLQLKQASEEISGTTYNSCLLNLYHSGEEGMGWHSDNEATLKKEGAIASFSFGAERKFSFKHRKTGETVSLMLEHGSLLLMKEATQHYWLHSLPKTKKVKGSRINLTFRSMKE